MLHVEERIKGLRQEINKAMNIRIRANARLEELKNREQEIEKELKELGVEPEQLAEEIARLEKEINEELNHIEQLLPRELLNNGREIG